MKPKLTELPAAQAQGADIVAAADEFQALLAQVRDGSQDAAWTLIELYGPHLQRVVRRKLNNDMRSKFDSIDFVQAVWLSFFRDRSQILDFRTPEQLVGFLAQVARNKVVDETRRRVFSQKHGVRKERPLDERVSEQATSQAGTPSQFAIAREAWEKLLAEQPTHYQSIIQLKYLGHTNREIAVKLDLHEKTIGRVLERLLRAP
jgi:RNA polymerase sigma-70 factor (ECF subfamily)